MNLLILSIVIILSYLAGKLSTYGKKDNRLNTNDPQGNGRGKETNAPFMVVGGSTRPEPTHGSRSGQIIYFGTGISGHEIFTGNSRGIGSLSKNTSGSKPKVSPKTKARGKNKKDTRNGNDRKKTSNHERQSVQ
jgi:hypothetical protein